MDSIHDIYKKFLDNRCTKEEKDFLFRYFDLDQNDQHITELIENELSQESNEELSPELQVILKRNQTKLQSIVSLKKKRNYKIGLLTASIAASLLLIFSVLYLILKVQEVPGESKDIQQKEILAGTNRASLILENGQTYDLREDGNGITVSNNTISYTDGTQITATKKPQIATLMVPRKGQYITVLPDGTKVWLNAESSLKYPTTFTEANRVVELQGEGYFKVAHDSKHPFIVKTSNQELKVLGTEFNLNSYSNERSTVTTLIEGSIQLNGKSGNAKEILKPNQQASLTQSNYTVKTVDVETYSSWKEGEFRFKSTSLPDVIRQLERWYDLDVNYKDIPSQIQINASISRDKKLSSVLEVISDISNVKLKVEGRRLMVIQ
ncbi:FecR family protein [Sphingobacterium sp.]|uniref:FecR family protein n=1 Tax=Sphingobacterium sp. TaxID=341027 RepID=UPI002584B502|nr:FecR family protein [Sphingobacterium sp.]WET69093.1 MAG: FecR domain-containing protein [Sphingobacterium sp.]